jgi:hypothetical protein
MAYLGIWCSGTASHYLLSSVVWGMVELVWSREQVGNNAAGIASRAPAACNDAPLSWKLAWSNSSSFLQGKGNKKGNTNGSKSRKYLDQESCLRNLAIK